MDVNLINSSSRMNFSQVSDGEIKVETEKGAEKPSLTVSVSRSDGAFGAEGIGAVDESVLTRDDPLGKLMKRAFDLQPPAMPKFE